MMLKSAQFSPLKHIIDFARVIRTTANCKLRARRHTSVETNIRDIIPTKIDDNFLASVPHYGVLHENIQIFSTKWVKVLPYCPTMVSNIERLLKLPAFLLFPFQRLAFHWKCSNKNLLFLTHKLKINTSGNTCNSVLVWDRYKSSPGEPLYVGHNISWLENGLPWVWRKSIHQ